MTTAIGMAGMAPRPDLGSVREKWVTAALLYRDRPSPELAAIVASLSWVLENSGAVAPITQIRGPRVVAETGDGSRWEILEGVFEEWLVAEVVCGRNDFVTEDFCRKVGIYPTQDARELSLAWGVADALGWVCGMYPTIESLGLLDG
jgi:hypothetical protein